MGLLRPYTNSIVNGSSSSGKTSLLKRLLMEVDQLYDPKPTLIIYVYKVFDPDFDVLSRKMGNRILFLDSLPEESQFNRLIEGQNHTLLCVDDALNFTSQKFFVDLFVCNGHHNKITSFIVTQHLYHKAPYTGTICQNAHIIILMPSPRDHSTILALGRQLGEYKVLRDIYRDILSHGPYSYLVMNLDPAAPRSWRYLTNILETDKGPLTIYIPT